MVNNVWYERKRLGSKTMIQKLILGILLSAMSMMTMADKVVEMDLGEIKIMSVGEVERVAVGNAKILSTSLLNNGQMLIIAESGGLTTLHIWYANGKEGDMEFHVREEDLKEVERLNTIEERAEEVRQLLSDIDDLTVRVIGGHIVLTGEMDERYEGPITTVKGTYTEVMDLTRRSKLDLPDDKMVLMDVKVTQFNRSYVENLGIQWDQLISGPSAGLALDGVNNRTFRGAAGLAPSFETNLPFRMTPAAGYFGIAAEITSRINLAVNDGQALILSQPKLAARSGGEATFLSGGEVPVVTTSNNGTNVEYKEFGISLTIKPEIDRNKVVHANVDVQVTSLGPDGAGGNPTFISKKTTADVSLKEKETLVLSGLIDENLQRSVHKLKGFAEIPILGVFFRNNTEDLDRKELVIFVTPTIHDQSSDFNGDYLNRQKEQVEKFFDYLGDSKGLDILD